MPGYEIRKLVNTLRLPMGADPDHPAPPETFGGMFTESDKVSLSTWLWALTVNVEPTIENVMYVFGLNTPVNS